MKEDRHKKRKEEEIEMGGLASTVVQTKAAATTSDGQVNKLESEIEKK